MERDQETAQRSYYFQQALAAYRKANEDMLARLPYLPFHELPRKAQDSILLAADLLEATAKEKAEVYT